MRIFAESLPASVIKATSRRAYELGAISLGQGIPSFRAPESAHRAAAQALEAPDIDTYPDYLGVPELRNALAQRLNSEVGPQVDGSNILITIGGMGACSTGLEAIVEPKDRVAFLTPDYATHFPLLEVAHVEEVQIPMRENGRWKLDISKVEDEAKRGMRALLITNPNNPTGSVLAPQEIADLVALSNQHGFWIIADETYSYLTYGKPFTSLLTHFTNSERIVVARSFSKEFCMTGWRVGYMVAPAGKLVDFAKVNDALIGTAPRISQVAALGALKAPPEYVSDQVAEYTRRKDYVITRLSNIPGFSVTQPEGTYYVFPSYGDGMQSEELSKRLLEEALVAVIPGAPFGEAGEYHLRISTGAEMPVLEEGLNRFERFVVDALRPAVGDNS